MEDKSMTAGNYRIIVLQAEGGKAHPPERGGIGLGESKHENEAKMAAAGLPNAPETVIEETRSGKAPGFFHLMYAQRKIVSYQARRGPRNTRAGSRMMAFNNSSTPSTANPKSRKGNSSNHTNGYRTSTNSASGQQKNNKMHHRRKVNITPPLRKYVTPDREVPCR